jgi:hypothetical protein
MRLDLLHDPPERFSNTAPIGAEVERIRRREFRTALHGRGIQRVEALMPWKRRRPRSEQAAEGRETKW